MKQLPLKQNVNPAIAKALGSKTTAPRAKKLALINDSEKTELSQKFLISHSDKSVSIRFINSTISISKGDNGLITNMRNVDPKDNIEAQKIVATIKTYMRVISCEQTAQRLQLCDVEGNWAQTFKQFNNRLNAPITKKVEASETE